MKRKSATVVFTAMSLISQSAWAARIPAPNTGLPDVTIYKDGRGMSRGEQAAADALQECLESYLERLFPSDAERVNFNHYVKRVEVHRFHENFFANMGRRFSTEGNRPQARLTAGSGGTFKVDALFCDMNERHCDSRGITMQDIASRDFCTTHPMVIHAKQELAVYGKGSAAMADAEIRRAVIHAQDVGTTPASTTSPEAVTTINVTPRAETRPPGAGTHGSGTGAGTGQQEASAQRTARSQTLGGQGSGGARTAPTTASADPQDPSDQETAPPPAPEQQQLTLEQMKRQSEEIALDAKEKQHRLLGEYLRTKKGIRVERDDSNPSDPKYKTNPDNVSADDKKYVDALIQLDKDILVLRKSVGPRQTATAANTQAPAGAQAEGQAAPQATTTSNVRPQRTRLAPGVQSSSVATNGATDLEQRKIQILAQMQTITAPAEADFEAYRQLQDETKAKVVALDQLIASEKASLDNTDQRYGADNRTPSQRRQRIEALEDQRYLAQKNLERLELTVSQAERWDNYARTGHDPRLMAAVDAVNAAGGIRVNMVGASGTASSATTQLLLGSPAAPAPAAPAAAPAPAPASSAAPAAVAAPASSAAPAAVAAPTSSQQPASSRTAARTTAAIPQDLVDPWFACAGRGVWPETSRPGDDDDNDGINNCNDAVYGNGTRDLFR